MIRIHQVSGFFILYPKPGFLLRVGLTGGIGSGKSTVAHIFEVLGVPVYYADEAAKRLYDEDETLKKAVIAAFGEATYRDDKLDRAHLAGIVFGDPEKLARLNAIVHPATIADAERWMARQTTPYAVKEAALIFESSAAAGLDKVIGVTAPEAMRVRRVMERDGVTEEEVRKRMRNQMDEEEKMRLCDYVIFNDESRLLIPQVLSIHDALSLLAQKSLAHG